jgi:replicative DNA helicase
MEMSQTQNVPFDTDSEAAVLGACMVDLNALDIVLDALRSDDFFKNAHQKVYQAVADLHKGSRPVDLVTVQDWLASRSMLESVGGPSGLAGLTEKVASAGNVEAYVRIVLENADARRLQAVGQQLASAAASRKESILNVLDEAAEALHHIASRDDKGSDEKALAEVTADEEQDFQDLVIGKQRGFTYEPANLCATIGPVVPGRMVVLAGRPGEGKSALLLHLGLELAKQGVEVLLLSLEMNMTELRARAAAWHSGCDATKLIEGPLNKMELDAAKRAWEQMRAWPFRASYVPGLAIGRLRARVRASIRKNHTKVVLVDYLQLVQPNGKAETMEQQIAEASSGLRLIAQQLGPAVVCAAQLNRSGEKGERRSPRISDLRGSGQIEQDAHIIGLIQTDDADAIADPEPLIIVTCAKRRMGSTGRAELRFVKRFSRFEKATREE